MCPICVSKASLLRGADRTDDLFHAMEMHRNANYGWHSTYLPVQSAKSAQSALFAAKLLPNLPKRATGLIVWDQSLFLSAWSGSEHFTLVWSRHRVAGWEWLGDRGSAPDREGRDVVEENCQSRIHPLNTRASCRASPNCSNGVVNVLQSPSMRTDGNLLIDDWSTWWSSNKAAEGGAAYGSELLKRLSRDLQVNLAAAFPRETWNRCASSIFIGKLRRH
jgi:hypothetical protein